MLKPFSYRHRALDETFIGGETGAYSYTEIYEDPTEQELSTFFGTSRVPQLGAILRQSYLYVWDRSVAEHRHMDAYLRSNHRHVSHPDDGYLYLDPMKRTTITGGLLVAMSQFTQTKRDLSAQESIVRRLLQTPTAAQVNFVFSTEPGVGFNEVRLMMRRYRVSPELTRLAPEFL